MPFPAHDPDAPFSLQSAFAAWRLPLLRFLQRKLGNASDAEDMVQESFIRLAAAERGGTVVERPRQFVFRIAANLACDHLRHAARSQVLFDADEDDGARAAAAPTVANPAARVEHRQLLALLERAIGELPQRQREALVMSRFEGLTQDAIAARMGISRRMVVRHLNLALAHCASRAHYPMRGEADCAPTF
ncbi:MAG: sigma-70 family RNA polymerase sigma factor [Pseudorhodoferax sp.]